jgi:hypothetical protein
MAEAPSHGKFSGRFCGWSRNYGRIRRQRSTVMQEQPMGGVRPNANEMARSAPQPSFGLPEVLVAFRNSRLPCSKPKKSEYARQFRKSSGESRVTRMITAYKYFNNPIETLTRANEAEFFAGIRLANMTFKTTAPGRMRELDAIIVRLARDRGWHRPAVLDVGVSSGVTTLDLLEAMTSSGLDPTIIATDMTVKAAILAIAPGIRVLVDVAGRPLQYDFFGLGIRAWNRRLDYLTGYYLLTKVAELLVLRFQKSHLKDVKLISRRICSAKSVADIVEDDLIVRNPTFENRFDIIRAANILNLSYFDVVKLRLMIENLKAYARAPGALFVISRTHQDGANHGTIFQISSDNVLHIVERIGNGSEIEAII